MYRNFKINKKKLSTFLTGLLLYCTSDHLLPLSFPTNWLSRDGHYIYFPLSQLPYSVGDPTLSKLFHFVNRFFHANSSILCSLLNKRKFAFYLIISHKGILLKCSLTLCHKQPAKLGSPVSHFANDNLPAAVNSHCQTSASSSEHAMS